MKLTVLGSNSAGNGYLLESSTGRLLIECGVHINEIKQAMKFDLGNVSCIVSHSHGDHAKSFRQVVNSGIDVYAGKHTVEASGCLGHHRAHVIEAGVGKYIIEGFLVKPFEVNHDVP
jgi:phosphoribosyl 1,2-cyclic phosphodiesterase